MKILNNVFFYLYCAAIQLLLFPYSLVFAFALLASKNNMLMNFMFLFGSLLPLISYVLIKKLKLYRLSNYLIAMLCVYLSAFIFLTSDYFPGLTVKVSDRYGTFPLENADVCYSIKGTPIITLSDPGILAAIGDWQITSENQRSRLLKESCGKTDKNGDFFVSKFIGFSPFIILDRFELKISKEGYEIHFLIRSIGIFERRASVNIVSGLTNFRKSPILRI